MRSCEEYEELISEFLDGALSKDEQIELMKHMGVCPVCQNYFNDLVAMHEALGETEEVPVPAGLTDRVMAKVHETAQESPAKQTKVIKLPHWRRWAALAACCAIAAAGLWTFQSWSHSKDDRQSLQAAVTASQPFLGEGQEPAAYDSAAAEPKETTDDAGVPAPMMEDKAGTVSGAETPERDSADNSDSFYAANTLREAAPEEVPEPAPAPAAPQANRESLKTAADTAADRDAPIENPAPASTAPASGGNSGGTSEAASLLTVEEAKAIALNHAGLTADDVTITEAKLDWEDGKQVYEVEFYAPGAQYDSAERTEYDYEIDAATGAVMKYDYDAESYHAPTDPNLIILTREAAQELVLAQVPGAAAEHITKLELDRDDGRDVYEAEVFYNGTEYEMELDARTGAVLKFEAED